MLKLATLIYVQDRINNKTLMLLRNKKENDIHRNKWNGLWWKLEIEESPDNCCRRELEEESGLIAKDIELKWILTAPNFTPEHDRYIFIYNVYSWTWVIKECDEWELQRIDTDKLLDLNLWEGDKYFIPLLNKDWVFHITARYKNWKLDNHKIN